MSRQQYTGCANTFDLVHFQSWPWGVAVLVLGLFAALYGAVLADPDGHETLAGILLHRELD